MTELERKQKYRRESSISREIEERITKSILLHSLQIPKKLSNLSSSAGNHWDPKHNSDSNENFEKNGASMTESASLRDHEQDSTDHTEDCYQELEKSCSNLSIHDNKYSQDPVLNSPLVKTKRRNWKQILRSPESPDEFPTSTPSMTLSEDRDSDNDDYEDDNDGDDDQDEDDDDNSIDDEDNDDSDNDQDDDDDDYSVDDEVDDDSENDDDDDGDSVDDEADDHSGDDDQSNESPDQWSDEDLENVAPNEETPERPKRRRRREGEPSEWMQNKRRILRNSGQEYIKVRKDANGWERKEPAKRVGSPCNCQRNCPNKIPEDLRNQHCQEFYALGKYDLQCQLLAALVLQKAKARHRTTGISRRKYSPKWQMKREEELAQVCKKFFLSTYSISDKKVRISLEKQGRSVTGTPSPDKRGRHPPANKLSDEDRSFVIEHINSLPLAPPHYVRLTGDRVYVEGNLNKSHAYRLFQTYAAINNRRAVSLPVYSQHLKQLKISFHQPRKDRCWCSDFREWSEANQEANRTGYELHIQRKEEARNEKKKDTEESVRYKSIMTVGFDMQAILFVPMLYNKEIYYKRKIATYNLSVYITNKHEGQNKNSVLVSMLIQSLVIHPSLQRIHLKFLEVGHTYQEVDSIHSLINRAAKKEKIYVPEDWCRVVRHAEQTGKPYVVHEMSQQHFLDFKAYR